MSLCLKDKKCLIEQREVGADTKSFAAALKHVLRQDPNVIVVGEMRDPETIATVLTAAETGHLVFSTLHTSSAAEAVERIVDVFEGPKQKQILIQLSAVLRGIVAQQLLPTVDGKRTVAREILINTPAVSNLIRENNIAQIASAMQTGLKDGMSTMENSLKQLVKDKLITEETAEKTRWTPKKDLVKHDKQLSKSRKRNPTALRLGGFFVIGRFGNRAAFYFNDFTAWVLCRIGRWFAGSV